MKNLKDWWHIAIIATVLSAAVQFGYYLVSDPVPYKDVVITSVERTDEGYVVAASFIKSECKFKRLEVFGINTGVPVYLEWKALDGSPATDYDRSIGKQYLMILAITSGKDHHTLEIRTRHDCDGKLVDKIFAKIDL